MPSVVTTQQLAEKFELLDPPQRQTVYEFISSLLRKNRPRDLSEKKRLLLETSIWTERDTRQIHEAQQDINEWRIPT